MSKPKGARVIAKGAGYIIRWRDESGRVRERRCVGETHEQATKELAEFVATGGAEPAMPAPHTGPRDPAQYPIADVLLSYLTEHAAHLSGQGPETARFSARRLAEFWSQSMVDAITPATCGAYARHRCATGAQPSTAARELAVLTAALNHALKEGRLTRSPVVIKPPAPPPRDRWLTRAEAARLLWESRRDRQARDHLPLFVRLAIYTGARSGAIFDLTWMQVDLVRGLINLNPPGRVETSKGRAKMPLTRHLLAALRRAHQLATGPYVVTEQGQRLGSVKRSFARACERAGLEDVTPHVLRHTCGTWLAQAGVPMWDISGWLGHSMTQTTEKYAHHCPDHLSAARDAMNGMSRKNVRR